MNIAFTPLAADTAPPSRLMEACERVVLGMPHLSLGGLSETWLLKELGHRHWQLLARMAGRAVPDFRDERGQPVYAAFCAVQISGAAFGELREHDELTIASAIARISHTQFASTHRLICRGRDVGTVELSSVFVKRGEAGRNRSIARVALDFFPPVTTGTGFGAAAAMAAHLRGNEWSEHFGFRRHEAGPQRCLSVNPCPAQDFNGADFLYFTSFQSFVDRAEWEFFGPRLPKLATRARDIAYHGNVEIGDRVTVSLMASRNEEKRLIHWCRLIRETDDALLADVFTAKLLSSA